jgi:hypothetical protein
MIYIKEASVVSKTAETSTETNVLCLQGLPGYFMHAPIPMNQRGKTRQTPLLYIFTESNTPGVVENPFRE